MDTDTSRQHDGSGPTPAQLASLLDRLQAQADVRWRYPICARLLPLVPRQVSANHITVTHAALGLSLGGLVAQNTYPAFLAAGLLLEVRALLDCLDGVVARARGTSSAMGRALDQTGDTVAFLSLLAGGGYCLTTTEPVSVAVGQAILLLVVGASCSTAWDFFGRRFRSLLRTGADVTAHEYLLLRRDFHEHPSPSLWLARFMGIYQWLSLAPATHVQLEARAEAQDWPDDEAPVQPSPLGLALREEARRDSPTLRVVLTLVGTVTTDNLILLMSITLLLGVFPQALVAISAWGIAAWLVTVIACNLYLGSLERHAQEAREP